MTQAVVAQDAEVQGQAARIPAAIKAQDAVLKATIQVTRAATGQVETYEIVGTALESQSSKEP